MKIKEERKRSAQRLCWAAERYISKRNQIQKEADEAISQALSEYELVIEKEKERMLETLKFHSKIYGEFSCPTNE